MTEPNSKRPRTERHPEPLESLDPRFLALLLKATTTRFIFRVGQPSKVSGRPYTEQNLTALALRLNTMRRKQKDLNPTLYATLYRASVRWNKRTGVLILEPRDSSLDDILTDATGQAKPDLPLPEGLPARVIEEYDLLNRLAEDKEP